MTTKTKAFADEVKELRKRLQATQTEFAGMMGVSFATVNRWENGHNEPKTELVREKLAELYQLASVE